jgi:hypothetical protein
MIKRDDLLSELKKNVQATPSAKPAKARRASEPTPQTAETPAVPEPAPTESAAKQFTGRPVGFWGDDEDRRILREFALVLYQAGLKPSESLAIRAALRLVSQEHRFGELVEQARTVLERDGRRLRHQKEAPKVQS